jgi:hypothetical protein
MPKRKNASVETEALAPAAGVTEATPPARGSTPPKRLAHDEPSGGAAAASQLSKLKRASLATLATHQLRENVGNAREVQVAIVVKKIFDLDTVNETFGCILGVTLKWKCPDGETPPESHNNDGDWEPEWTPKFAVRNTMEECVDAKALYTTSSEPVEGRADGSEQLWVVMDGEYILRIYEALELESFPYDCQTLPIYLESRLPTTEFVLVPLKALNQPVVTLSADVNNANDFDLIGGEWFWTLLEERKPRRLLLTALTFVRSPRWACVPLCTEMPFGFELYVAHSDSRSAKTGRTFSGICVYVMMARHTAYYVFNVVCVMGILATMCMTAWCIHPADIPSRHGVDFTLSTSPCLYLLAAVAAAAATATETARPTDCLSHVTGCCRCLRCLRCVQS